MVPPVHVPLPYLRVALKNAEKERRPVLVLCPGSGLVDAYFRYQSVVGFDCAKACLEVRTPVNNIEYFPPNFERLVLGCIDADFCK